MKNFTDALMQRFALDGTHKNNLFWIIWPGANLGDTGWYREDCQRDHGLKEAVCAPSKLQYRTSLSKK